MPVIHGVLLLAGLAAFTAAALGAGRILTARTIRRIDRMLQAAIDGTFLESSFDETRLSALEARMVRYLSENAVTAQGLAAEKDQDQSADIGYLAPDQNASGQYSAVCAAAV